MLWASALCCLVLTICSLASQVEDENLERQVTKVFSRYGTVFVKIRRDARKMPFAFCQFTVCCPFF